jgi:hypothetical protein
MWLDMIGKEGGVVAAREEAGRKREEVETERRRYDVAGTP